MSSSTALTDSLAFSNALFEIMKQISPAVEGLELYEFRYCLENLTPVDGWDSVLLDRLETIEENIDNRAYYERIKVSSKFNEKPVLDEPVVRLAQMLFIGLVSGAYPEDWVNTHFYFDLRGFFFLHRTSYFTPDVVRYLSGSPYRQFEPKQKEFERVQTVGYQEFKRANAEVDGCFMDLVSQLIAIHGTPVLIGIAGPTAAGKTEIVARLCEAFAEVGRSVTSIEMDHFLMDRDYREERGIDSLGREALHIGLFLDSLRDICAGKKITTPRYDFISATSSHDVDGNLKSGAATLEVQPADIIFIEGNFPFLLPEVAEMVGIKVVYLTNDDVRLKRKWRRDMDFRKKYELNYFRNRYFREQFLMAQSAYISQLEMCDLAVDTTNARVWVTPHWNKQLMA